MNKQPDTERGSASLVLDLSHSVITVTHGTDKVELMKGRVESGAWSRIWEAIENEIEKACEGNRMNKQEIKAAMLKSGALHCYLGTKWGTHYDPRAATYPEGVSERHGGKRCSIFVTDDQGITTQSGKCNCHYGEWLAEPEAWAVALLEMLA